MYIVKSTTLKQN